MYSGVTEKSIEAWFFINGVHWGGGRGTRYPYGCEISR